MSTIQERFYHWLANDPDEAMLRWIFRGLLTTIVAVLAADIAWIDRPEPAATPAEIRQETPLPDNPSVVPAIPAPLPPGADRRVTQLPEPEGALAMPMTFELVGGGRLLANGTITPGISQAFAAEIGKRGDYIKTVVLNSPGGSVVDALAMGRLIREKNIGTEVAAGKYCASSCPLMFAGGIERRAGEKATIGVHQVAAIRTSIKNPAQDEMNMAQGISALCQRYLGEMGVSLQVWIHAMETPHDKLFVFKPNELRSLNLVTTAPATAPMPSASAK